MQQSGRHLAREAVLKGLYALEIGVLPAEEVLKNVVLDDGLCGSAIEYARVLFERTREGQPVADGHIARLAKNWELERIAVIDRIVLRIAITELREMSDVPVKVVLNEAIELAKKFSTSESSGFVNGILDSYLKEHVDGDRINGA